MTSMPALATERRAWKGLLGLVAAAAWLSLLWALPVQMRDFRPRGLAVIAAEVALLLAVLALIRPLREGRTARAMRLSFAALTTLVVALLLAELAIRSSLSRPFNLLLDVQLAEALVHLLTGTLGGALGWSVLLGLVFGLVAVFALSLIAVGTIQRALGHHALRRTTLSGCAAVGASLLLQTALPDAFARYRPVSLRTSATLWAEWQRSSAMLAELEEFERRVAEDPFRHIPAERLLRGLGGADVLLMFVESYGRSALEQPRYVRLLGPRLEAFERRLEERGLSAVSGYLTSPTVGGQSWLAHGTIESGLWLAHQRHYDLLVQSDRLTLSKVFAAAGYRTIAVKPAIIFPWPEGEAFGYEKIDAAADLGYAGKPYNWVTMPDQYTLSVLQRRERGRRARSLFAEISLISSHAPWTPIPPVLDDWSTIGDGAVFSRWADLGDPPEVVWRDPERVRRQYALALDYVLGVLASYAGSFVDEHTLLIMLGDHQSAPLITGDGAGRDVPMHVISGDPELLAPFRAWGFSDGMRPADDVPVHRMDAFRDWFLTAYGDGALATAEAR